MAGERLRGGDCRLWMTIDGELVQEIPVQNLTFRPQVVVDRQSYLGEQAPRGEERWEGVEFEFTAHAENSDASTGIMAMYRAAMRRAQRIDMTPVFNASWVAAFPGGDLRTITIADVKLENPEISQSSNDYVTFSASGFGSNLIWN